MISAIIPTYRNPKYLDLCLKSMVAGKLLSDTEVIVIVDGFVNESAQIVANYDVSVIELPQQEGMARAINHGVYNASGDFVFILNDDNVAPPGWDLDMANIAEENSVVSFNQIEPQESIFHFPVKNLGTSPETFDYHAFVTFEKSISTNETSHGMIFPFLISRKLFMVLGGFDVAYQSPFWVDVDFMVKAAMYGVTFYRSHKRHFYHFGSRATKNRTDDDAKKFSNSESPASQWFAYKWRNFSDISKKVLQYRLT